jgi:ADP-ribosylglycohydrolase
MQLPLKVIENRLHQEINSRKLMGYQVDGLSDQLDKVRGDRKYLQELHDSLNNLPIKPDWPYNEPSDLEGIRRERPILQPQLPPFYLSELEIGNKTHGAWLGRAAGCVLGKPLEVGWTMEQIRDYLDQANALPLNDYLPSQSRNGMVMRRDSTPSMRGYVHYVQEDDDINYMCLAVKLLEDKGPGFTTLDVGVNWLNSIPFMWTWGPEHVVYLNLATAIGEYDPEDVDLEAVAGSYNPSIEYIGAQIRADVYGYICPGMPEKAAELAWRDAYLTHRMSGIYGAMWVAAMNASAFTLMDMEQVIIAGLSQVPQNTRFSEAIQKTMQWCREDRDWWKTGIKIHEIYNQYDFGGTINNACCVTAALLYGWGDGRDTPSERYERAITIAVQLAYDTDCNAATVGSIVGLMIGAGLLPQKWIAQLNNTLRTCVAGFGQVSITEMAQRTFEISRIIRAM